MTTETRPPVLAIDPPDCGCTECMTGVYVPLSSATPEQILAAQLGKIADNTSGLLPEMTAEVVLMKLQDQAERAIVSLASEAGSETGWRRQDHLNSKAEGVRQVLDWIDEALGELR